MLTLGRPVVKNGAFCPILYGEKDAKGIFWKKFPSWEIHANFGGHMEILLTLFVLVISHDRKIILPWSWYRWKAGDASYNFYINTLYSIPFRFLQKTNSLAYIRFFVVERWQRSLNLILLWKFLSKMLIENVLECVLSFQMVHRTWSVPF